MPIPKGLRKWTGKLFWPFLYLGLWEILLRAQNPGLMTDDSGEIVTAASCLGIGHGPGFPLYILLARLAGFLPMGTLAFRLNLLAAFFTLLAIHFTVTACRELWKKLLPNDPGALSILLQKELWLVFTALSLLFCESVFAQSLTAKGGIYTFTLMGFAVMLWACIGELSDARLLWALFFWSIGMGNHWPFQVFGLLLLLIRFGPRIFRWGLLKILSAASFILIGLSTFLYLPLRAENSPVLNWENPRVIGAFWSVLSRRNAPAGEFAGRNLEEYARNVLEYLRVMGLHWWPGFVLLAAAGAWFLFRRQRGLLLAYSASYAALVAAIVRVTHFDENTLYLETNFLVCTQALPALLGFAGALALCNRWLGSRPKAAFGVALAAVLAVASWGAAVFDRQQKTGYTLAEDIGANLLKELPWNALVLLDSDVTIMPGLYQRYAQDKRPDIAMVFLPLIQSKWGFAQAVAEYKARMNPSGAVRGFQDALRLFMDPERFKCSSVFYAYYKQNLEQNGMGDLAGRLSPWGLSYRLGQGTWEPGKASWDVWNITSRQRLRNLDSAKNLPGTEFTCFVYRYDYARPHLEMGSILLKNGYLYDSVRHYQKALLVYPGMRGVYRDLASYFETAGYPEMAEVFSRKEATIAPDSAGALEAHGNILMKLGYWKRAADAYGRCLKINPSSPDARLNRETALRNLSASPPIRVLPGRRAEDYIALGKKYERDREGFLASVAYEAARGQ